MASDGLIAELGALPPQTPPSPAETVSLAAYCYAERATLLPALNAALTQCGGWLLERKATSAAAMEFVFEVQLQTVLDLYAAVVSIGVELTRDGHAALRELCTCMQHPDSSSNPFHVVTLRLKIHFLADVTLHSILMTGADLA